jgi:hypothetical protein
MKGPMMGRRGSDKERREKEGEGSTSSFRIFILG